MNDLFGKYRDLIAISTLVVVPLALLFFTGRDREKFRPLSSSLGMLTLPVELASDAVVSSVDDVWTGYVALVGVQEENVALKTQVEALTGELLRLKHVEIENRRLKGLCEFKEQQPEVRYLPARVVGRSLTQHNHVLRIALEGGDTDAQVAPGLPVVTHGGLVGRVERVVAGVADVMLIVDPRSRLNVKVAEKGVTGTLVGGGRGDRFVARLLHVQKGSDVERLDTVVTSGYDGVFPADIEIGYVSSEGARQTGLFYEVEVTPAVDFGRLEEVLVRLDGPAAPAAEATP